MKGRRGPGRPEPKARNDRGNRPPQNKPRGESLPPPPAPPPPVRAPAVPREVALPREHQAVWTCRAGFEPYLFEELAWAGASPSVLGPGLVESRPLKQNVPPPSFARAGFVVGHVAETPDELICSAQDLVPEGAAHVQVWVPDTDSGNALASEIPSVELAVKDALSQRTLDSFNAAKERGAPLLQVCILSPRAQALGVQHPSDALSPAPGGRHRMWRESSTSRASMKLDEALDSLAIAPGRGDLCVDLGAAPGGWTERLLQRGARVIAVDPANMAPHLATHGKLRHVKASAFSFEPEEPCDWLFCDMAWRPLEVAQLLAKWGRRGFASQLVANLKLPMKDKNQILHKARFILERHGGWRNLRVRQLYHDRDEVTVTAVKTF